MTDTLFDVEHATSRDDSTRPSLVSLVLRLHVEPGPGQAGVTGRYKDALGVRVAPPANSPQSNAACVELLGELFDLEVSAVIQVAGEKNKDKRFRLSGVDLEVFRRRLLVAVDSSSNRPGRRKRDR